jgi:hypothetical protein
MTDPVVIERADLIAMAEACTRTTLEALGIKAREVKPWISQNKAAQLVGFKRLKRAMAEGRVEFRKDHTRVKSKYQISMRDVQKLIRQPQL